MDFFHCFPESDQTVSAPYFFRKIIRQLQLLQRLPHTFGDHMVGQSVRQRIFGLPCSGKGFIIALRKHTRLFHEKASRLCLPVPCRETHASCRPEALFFRYGIRNQVSFIRPEASPACACVMTIPFARTIDGVPTIQALTDCTLPVHSSPTGSASS